jgi:hypothetical protein
VPRFLAILIGLAAVAVACVGGAHAMCATVAAAPAPDCTAVNLIGVRGSGDTLSKLGMIATALDRDLALRAGCAGESYQGYGIPYTAVGISWSAIADGLQLPEYRLSVRDGRNKLSGFIHEQTRDCPSEDLAVVRCRWRVPR